MHRPLLALTVAAALGLTVPATAAAPLKFKGTTSQKRTVSFTVSGGKVKPFSAGITMMCIQSGIEFNAVIPPKALRVKRGRFSYRGRDATDGTNITISGRVKGRSASGTLTMSDSRYRPSDGTFDTCASGTVTFSAKAKR